MRFCVSVADPLMTQQGWINLARKSKGDGGLGVVILILIGLAFQYRQYILIGAVCIGALYLPGKLLSKSTTPSRNTQSTPSITVSGAQVRDSLNGSTKRKSNEK